MTDLLVLSQREVTSHSPRTTYYPVVHWPRKLLLAKESNLQGGEGTIARGIS